MACSAVMLSLNEIIAFDYFKKFTLLPLIFQKHEVLLPLIFQK